MAQVVREGFQKELDTEERAGAIYSVGEKSMLGRANNMGKGQAAPRVREGDVGDEDGWVYGAAWARTCRFGEKGLQMLQEDWATREREWTETRRLPELADTALPLLLSCSQKPLNFHLLLWGFN